MKLAQWTPTGDGLVERSNAFSNLSSFSI